MKKYFAVLTLAFALTAIGCASSENTINEDAMEQDTVRTDVLEGAEEMNQDSINNINNSDTAQMGNDTTNLGR